MGFTTKKVQTHNTGIGYIKWATLFFLGMSCVLFAARAFEIEPIVNNAIQYIGTIYLNQEGNSANPAKITLSGANGNGYFDGTVKATTVNGITLSGTNIKGTIITGSTICLANDNTSATKCITNWPTVSAGGGASLWSTWTTASKIYYNLDNVGIWLVDPLYPLQVSGTIFANTLSGNKICLGGVCRIDWPTGGTIIGGDSVRSSWTNKIYYTSGNVGIGTNSPWYPLEISGDVKIQNTLLMGDIHFWKIYKDASDILNIEWFNALSNNRSGKDIYINWWYSWWNTNTVDGNVILANKQWNVGIGTATPSAKLHVAGSGIFDGNVGIGTTGPTAKLEVKDLLWNITLNPDHDGWMSTININAYSALSSGFKIGHAYFWGGFGFIQSNEPFLVYISNLSIPAFSISTGGNVGIGTATPTTTSKLAVNGTTLLSGDVSVKGSINMNSNYDILRYDNQRIGIGRYNAWWEIHIGQSLAVWWEYGWVLGTRQNDIEVWALYWNGSGNVGIGTATPTAKLEVNWAVKIWDDSTINIVSWGSCAGKAWTLIYKNNRFWMCSGSPALWSAL